MLIFPAIDIKNGTCVRLYQGEMSTAEQVANSALEAAGAFKAAGASWVHMVDLDGAVEGVRKNTGIFLEVVQESGLKVEVGGGIRTMADIAFYLENGISRVILGSIALPDLHGYRARRDALRAESRAAYPHPAGGEMRYRRKRRRDKSQRYCRPAGLRAVRRDLRTLDL